MKKNRPIAAAQTASIGDRDMMTFLPGSGATADDDAPSRSTAAGASSSADGAGGINDQSILIDDDAFDASLDALLREASCYDAPAPYDDVVVGTRG